MYLPRQTYIPTKHTPYYSIQEGGGASGGDDTNQLSQSQDSTHFVGNGPNPLFDPDMLPFTGDHAELSFNTDYFSVGNEGSINRSSNNSQRDDPIV